jgi:hypothetical protein
VKATREAFERAIAPVLADLERHHPGVLRLALEPEDSELQAWLWEPDGSGTGVYFGDGWDDEAEAIVELTDKVQEAAIEAVWASTGNGNWPVCPEHRDGAPLGPAVHRGAAHWFCSHDNRAIAEVGSLGLTQDEATPR